MIFLLKGKLWTDSSASSSSRNDIAATTVSMLIGRSRKNHLQHDDFCGQLIAWAQQNELYAPSSILPISTQTVQAPTDVEAFTLMADDPKHVLLLKSLRTVSHCDTIIWAFSEGFFGLTGMQRKNHS